eukprot:NODE_972_length_2821_cov_1.084864.p4 type:complete len:179 gc:universal NODE_972_length_2821_cov_1.084864:2233-1697(-)
MDWCIESSKVKHALESTIETRVLKYDKFIVKYSDSLTYRLKFRLMRLLKSNMRKIYELTDSWDDEIKLKELDLPVMRYIAIRDNSRIVGFVSYTFIHEHDENFNFNSLFIFELQIRKTYQGQGIGLFLLKCCINLAKRYSMDEVRLSCYKHNPAFDFYLKNGFDVYFDEKLCTLRLNI